VKDKGNEKERTSGLTKGCERKGSHAKSQKEAQGRMKKRKIRNRHKRDTGCTRGSQNGGRPMEVKQRNFGNRSTAPKNKEGGQNGTALAGRRRGIGRHVVKDGKAKHGK